MPGIATHFEILRLTIDRLNADPTLTPFADIINNNLPYAHLGAIGPALGDFIPSDRPEDLANDPNPYALVWKMIFGLVGGDPGFLKTLQEMREMLETFEQIANDEDMDAICALKDDPEAYQKIETAAAEFLSLISSLQAQAGTVLGILGDDMKPVINTDNVADPVPPPKDWQIRDFLHWKRTGLFVKNLIQKAKDTGDNRLLAYAYGFLIAYSANVCGSPFVNSIVGGPARTQWWRQRFIKNYIDAWVYGFYGVGATMSGDTPSVPYDDPSWPNLCEANLQQKIEIGSINAEELVNIVKTAQAFPPVLPEDFAQRWFQAFEETYGGPLPDRLSHSGVLNGAYLMQWLVLWFQTSGQVFGCNLSAPLPPPDDCGTQPGELDPFQTDADGNPILPPTPEPDYDTDIGAVICGILLALLGGGLILGGHLVAGGAAIAGAVDLLDCDSAVDFNFKKLRCDLYWYRIYLYNGLQGVHKLLALSGFGYPHARYLAQDTDTLSLLPLEFESGKNTVKSRSTKENFPSKPWNGSPLTFNQPPTSFETPRTIAYMAERYPTFFIDDDATNPLSNGDVKTLPKGMFPFRQQPTTGAVVPVQFGNVVANAIDLFKNIDKDFPNWNLDGDRGLAYVTWQLEAGYNPDAVAIEPES